MLVFLQARVNKSKDFLVEEKPSIVYGGIRPDFIHATKTENFLVGKNLNKMETLKGATGENYGANKPVWSVKCTNLF